MERIKTLIKSYVRDPVWLWFVRKYKTRLGWRARPYEVYYQQAKRLCRNFGEIPKPVLPAVRQFNEEGWATLQTPETEEIAAEILQVMRSEESDGEDIWNEAGRYKKADVWQKFPRIEKIFTGIGGEFLKGVYGCEYKILFGVSYKSQRQAEEPVGSQLWHFDGSPGTCINLMYCLGPVGPENGAMECMSWEDTYRLFVLERKQFRQWELEAAKLTKEEVRARRALFLKEKIDCDFANRVNQPKSNGGMLFFFRNNLLHKGGFVSPSTERFVCVFNIYPSQNPPPFDEYRARGIPKTTNYPKDPDF